MILVYIIRTDKAWEISSNYIQQDDHSTNSPLAEMCDIQMYGYKYSLGR
jgi:hypothetical protein